MKVLSLFSGIGAFEKALSNLHINYDLVNYCEIDKYASKVYSAIHNIPESKNLGDITQVDTSKLPNGIDFITYGFPCQDISSGGKRHGFEYEGERTRSGLFCEALRIIEDCQPMFAICENVKNLTTRKFEKEFNFVLDSLKRAGYNNYWKVLNSKDYGIPQNRERVFIISIRADIDRGYTFPTPMLLPLKLQDILEDDNTQKGYVVVDEKIKPSVRINFEREKNKIAVSNKDIYMCECDSGWQDNKVGVKLSPTLRADNDNTFVLTNSLCIRKLLNIERFRLMGFSDNDFYKAEAICSNRQLSRQSGNSIVVSVLESILGNLIKQYKEIIK